MHNLATSVWDVSDVLRIVNSSLVTSTLAALVGAYFGAHAATRFAERREEIRQQIDRLKANNTAVTYAAAIANHALGFKADLARPLVTNFNKDRERYLKFLAASQAGEQSGPFVVEYDFRDITHFKNDSDELRKLVLADSAEHPIVAIAAMNLWQSLNSLDLTIETRKRELERLAGLRQDNQISDDKFAHIYFGVTTKAGNTDERYSDTVRNLEELLDSTIFYSKYIADKFGIRTKKLASQIGKASPKPVIWNLDNLKDPSLLPDPKDFSDFT